MNHAIHAGAAPQPWPFLRGGPVWLLALTGCQDFFIRSIDPVVEPPIVVEESFVQVPMPKVDILWVIDDTASMAEEQEALADAFASFSTGLQLAGLAWQVGVVTTDIQTEDAGILLGDPWIVTPTTVDPDAALADIVQVGTAGVAPEGGLGAAWLALSPPRIDDENRGFMRADAGLHVVVLSDDDDDSASVLGEDPTVAFLDFVAALELTKGDQPVRLSAIVGDTPSGCTGGSRGITAQAGQAYVDVAMATGGIFASICEADFGAIVEDVATTSIAWPRRFSLQAEPQADTLRVEVDEVRMDDGWTLESAPPALLFDDAPEADAIIRVRYELSL